MFFTDANHQPFDSENWELPRSSSIIGKTPLAASNSNGASSGSHGFTSLFQDVTNNQGTSLWGPSKQQGGASRPSMMLGTDFATDMSTELHSRTGSGGGSDGSQPGSAVVERPGAPLPPRDLLDLLGCAGSPSAHEQNSSVGNMGRQLTSDTVMSWYETTPQFGLETPSSPTSLPFSPITGRESPSPVAPLSSTLVGKGDFLCASKLLMLAQTQAAADPNSGWASRSTTNESDRRSPSPSRSPLPSIHAVLQGIDDDSPARPSVPSAYHQQYASFSVSAGGSRDPTPVSPTGMSEFQRFPTTYSQRSHGTSPPMQHDEPSARRAMRSHRVPNVQQPQAKQQALELTAPQTCVLVLEFKMGRKLRCRCSEDMARMMIKAPNSYFVVQIDSSGVRDCGVCVQVVSMNDRHILNRAFGAADQATVVRQANEEDCFTINNTLPDLEAEALQQCYQLIHFLHLPFICEDAEYSFDQSSCKLFYKLAPMPCTSIVPNVSRLQRELSFKLKCKVSVEQTKQ